MVSQNKMSCISKGMCVADAGVNIITANQGQLRASKDGIEIKVGDIELLFQLVLVYVRFMNR